jgi:hypothetical protein
MKARIAIILTLFALVGAHAAEPSPEQFQKMLEKVMAETKVNARMGLRGAVKDFKSDGDPKTLEIVFLEHRVPGANTVSEDGEAIFLFEPSEDVQQKLIGQAFEIRTRARLKGA